MGYTAPGPPALSCRRAPPQVSCSDPCSPTRYPDRPTAHATSSRQAPATLTGPRPCYSGHVTPKALPPSVGRGFRPHGHAPTRFRRRIGHASQGSAPSPPAGRGVRVENRWWELHPCCQFIAERASGNGISRGSPTPCNLCISSLDTSHFHL